MKGEGRYWQRTLSRRQALRSAAAAGGGIAALSLIGCGSDDEEGGSGSSTGGASTSGGTSTGGGASTTVDSTKGTPGGTLKRYIAGYRNPTLLDNSRQYDMAGWAMSSLLSHSWGVESVGLDEYFKLEPDLAQALPEQPDDTTFIYKLRPGVKFHNGRPLTTEDVSYSYDRYTNLDRSTTRVAWRFWFDHIEAPDAQTVVVKAKQPFADSLVSMAGNRDGYILAKEHEESPDRAEKPAIGTGPFILESFTAPVQAIMRKNPDYYRKPFPYFDRVEHFATTDPAKRIADFTTGQVHIPWLVYAEERDQIKQQRPDAVVQTYDTWGPALAMRTDRPPFNDKRVRQALSMAVDRKKISDAVTKGEGRPDQWLSLMYKNVLGSRGVTDLGDPGKYWQYNVSEAKKLLSAAGVSDEIKATNSHWNAGVVGQWFVDLWVLAESLWKEAGVADVTDNPQLAAQHSQTTNRGQYDGMAGSVSGGSNSGAPAFTLGFRDKWYWGSDGEHAPANLSYVNNPQLNDLVQKQLSQLKLDDRKQTYRQMEPIIAEEQYYIVFNTTTQSWFWDPKLRNIRISKEQGNHVQYAMKWWFG